MVTVEVDPVHVESRLAAGGIGCPTCGDGVLGGWGYARARQIEGLSDPLRPRRARCRACTVTHVLLPVTVLLRRAYAAERIWAALIARAEGAGHRRIGVEPGDSGGDGAGLAAPRRSRGWRRFGSGFCGVAVAAGVDVRIPDGTGCAWRDVVAAVATATAAIRFRFGAAGLLRRGDAGAGGGRGQWWSAAGTGMVATTRLSAAQHQSPLTRSGVIGDPRQGACPATVSGRPSIGEENREGVVGGAQAPRAGAGDRVVPLSADLPGLG